MAQVDMCTKPNYVQHGGNTVAKGLLGDHSRQVLVNTMVYLMGLSFAFRTGDEHRRLRYHPSQIQLVEPPNGTAYLHYKMYLKQIRGD